MLIALIGFFGSVVIPQIGALFSSLLEPFMIMLMTLILLSMLVSAFGVTFSTNIGSTVVSGIFSSVGYICVTIVNSIGWIIRTTLLSIPTVYRHSREFFSSRNFSNNSSTFLASFTTFLYVVIII